VSTRAIMVRVDGKVHHVYGFARDISSSGMGMKTFNTLLSYPIDVGERVRLAFRLPDRGREIECDAEVVWNEASSGDRYEIMHQGFRFTGMRSSCADELRRWLITRG
jgi:hypothetical protein